MDNLINTCQELSLTCNTQVMLVCTATLKTIWVGLTIAAVGGTVSVGWTLVGKHSEHPGGHSPTIIAASVILHECEPIQTPVVVKEKHHWVV